MVKEELKRIQQEKDERENELRPEGSSLKTISSSNNK